MHPKKRAMPHLPAHLGQSLVFLLLLLTVAVDAYSTVFVEGRQSLRSENESILAVDFSSENHILTVYTNTQKLLVPAAGGLITNSTLLDGDSIVTDIESDSRVGTVTVDYFGRCISLESPTKKRSSIGVCSGAQENVTKLDIYPYDVAIGPNGVIAFSDELNNSIKLWNTLSGEITTFISDEKLVRPRGIVYDSSRDSYYITMSNGVYSSRDKKVIAGISQEYQFGLKDGKFDVVRFGHPTGIILLRPGLLAVADYSNDRVRIVDVVGETVETLCPRSVTDSANDISCVINKPISLAINENQTELYIGTTGELLLFELKWSPVNLCYGMRKSGEADITVNGFPMKVWCDLDAPDGPWITLMKRYDGSEDFNRTYAEYTAGFGALSGEHWLGLENMHQLTKDGNAKLRMDIEGFAGRVPKSKPLNAYAEYTKFVVGESKGGYMLEEIKGYSGTAGDMETIDDRTNLGGPHRGKMFSTLDKDEDAEADNCAKAYNGGWWFSHCYTVCLTCGPYTERASNGIGSAMIYFPYTLRKTSLKSASMKVKLPESALWKN